MLLEKFESKLAGKRSILQILAVEDSESDLVLLENLLQNSSEGVSFKLENVPRLADAFKIIKNQKFDIVLLDLNLLDIQGIACVAALHAEIPEVPIIVFSGMDDPKLFKEALLCGAHSYLVKGRETGHNLKEIIAEAAAKL